MRVHPRLLVLIAALSLVAAGAEAEADDGVPSFARAVPAVRTGAPLLTFNGKDLTGFYPYTKEHRYEDPNRVFTVKDGVLRISGEEFGGVATCGNFANYHLIAEWKWGEKTWAPRQNKARDSGILLHCVGPDGLAGGRVRADGFPTGQWMESIECQIIEGGCGDFLVVSGLGKPSLTCEARLGPDRQRYYEAGGEAVTLHGGGRINWWGRDPNWVDSLGHRGPRDVEKPLGEWNRMEVLCDGDTIVNIVNGLVVNVATRSSLTMGKIQFQSEGAEIFFRKIEIRPILKSAAGRGQEPGDD